MKDQDIFNHHEFHQQYYDKRVCSVSNDAGLKLNAKVNIKTTQKVIVNKEYI